MELMSISRMFMLAKCAILAYQFGCEIALYLKYMLIHFGQVKPPDRIVRYFFAEQGSYFLNFMQR